MGSDITLKAIDGHEFAVYRAPAQGERKGGLIGVAEYYKLAPTEKPGMPHSAKRYFAHSDA